MDQVAENLFADFLKSKLDVPEINAFFVRTQKKTIEVLQRLRPEGRIDGGRFKLASIEGGAGSSFDFNLQNGHWGDWAQNDSHHGLVGFVCATMKCSDAQAVQFLLAEKFLDSKEAKKALVDSDGDPLVLPIPEDMQSWEVVLQSDALRKDRGILRDHWTFRDLDGSLLGYKYRVDSRNTTKEVYTLTYRAHSGWTKKDWAKKFSPPYGLEALRDGPTIRVLFVEGERAKDAAQEMFGERWKILSYSGVKGSETLWLPDEAFWQDCDVVIWPDNDTPGREAARKLQLSLEKLKNQPEAIRIVRVENIPGLTPGWDLADYDGEDTLNPENELERAEKIDSFEYICRHWVYVLNDDRFHNLEDRLGIVPPAAFDRNYVRYGDKTGTASKKFLAELNTQKAFDLDFLPGYGTFITTPYGKVLLNEWFPTDTYVRASEIAGDPDIPDEEIAEKAKYFVAHLDRIADNETVEPEKNIDGLPLLGTEGRLLRDALAHYFSKVLTHPMDKQGWVPVLVSEHNGTGKSYFRRVMEAIHGGKRVQELTVQRYVSDYEDWQDGCLFYELNEARSVTNSEVYELLKKNHSYKPFNMAELRDRSQGVRHINIKGSKQKQQRNFLNGYITSNDLFPLALANSSGLEGSDRRLLAVNCERILTEIEADELFDELNANAEWIGAWLMRYKSPVPWNPGWAPITAHKRRMLEKDRERSENRTDKYELGRFVDFFGLIKWCIEDKIGAFARPVVTTDGIRAICDARQIKFPMIPSQFNNLAIRAGLIQGPDIILEGRLVKTYTTDDKLLEKPSSEWVEILNQPINQPRGKKTKAPIEDDGGGHF
jgi:hypothetical protein